ncbi:MAG: trigger factor [Deltaproteobacteria bacterium]|nr:MAG: trigger factor [Deltaproteobacteria bacterium]
MNIEVIADGSYRRTLQVVVPAATVEQQLDRALRQVGGKARLRGFRPGKAPRKVIEARFGPQVAADVAADLIQDAYTKAIADHELEPVSRPAVDREEDPRRGVDFTFSISVEVRPSITLETWTGADVVYPSAEVDDAELEAKIQERLVENQRLVEVVDRPVGEDDQVMVELHIFDGDEEVVTELGTMVKTAGDAWYTGLEAHLQGMGVDEEKTFEVAFDAAARVESVAGKTLKVTAKVLSIQTYQVPELTDELAEELGYEGGAEGMKLAIRAELQGGRDELARNQARANLLQVLIDANDFDVPPGMIDQQLEILLNELRLQQAYRGVDPRQVHFSEAQLADLRLRSEFAVKGGLILDFVGKVENIEVTDEDVERKLQELADERMQDVEVIRAYFEQQDQVDDLRERLFEEKTLDWLLEHANIVASTGEGEGEGTAPEPPLDAAPPEGTGLPEEPSVEDDEDDQGGTAVPEDDSDDER